MPDTTGCAEDDRGPWLQTYSGKRLHLLDPRPDEIDIEDIARGLAHMPRFSGQTSRFYSVAEHSLACRWLAFGRGRSLPEQAAALMHDAAEAYIGDMPRPLKLLLPDYSEIEDGIMSAVRERFGIEFFDMTEIDNCVLALEKEILLPNSEPWPGVEIPDRDAWAGLMAFQPPIEVRWGFVHVARQCGVIS